MTADSTARRERLAALVRARKPATQADWLALADEDEWLAMLETGGLAPHEWAELEDEQRARVVELVVVEERPLVETLRLASDETKGTARGRWPARPARGGAHGGAAAVAGAGARGAATQGLNERGRKR